VDDGARATRGQAHRWGSDKHETGVSSLVEVQTGIASRTTKVATSRQWRTDHSGSHDHAPDTDCPQLLARLGPDQSGKRSGVHDDGPGRRSPMPLGLHIRWLVSNGLVVCSGHGGGAASAAGGGGRSPVFRDRSLRAWEGFDGAGGALGGLSWRVQAVAVVPVRPGPLLIPGTARRARLVAAATGRNRLCRDRSRGRGVHRIDVASGGRSCVPLSAGRCVFGPPGRVGSGDAGTGESSLMGPMVTLWPLLEPVHWAANGQPAQTFPNEAAPPPSAPGRIGTLTWLGQVTVRFCRRATRMMAIFSWVPTNSRRSSRGSFPSVRSSQPVDLRFSSAAPPYVPM
jgi:hypothetical protein